MTTMTKTPTSGILTWGWEYHVRLSVCGVIVGWKLEYPTMPPAPANSQHIFESHIWVTYLSQQDWWSMHTSMCTHVVGIPVHRSKLHMPTDCHRHKHKSHRNHNHNHKHKHVFRKWASTWPRSTSTYSSKKRTKIKMGRYSTRSFARPSRH